MTDAVLKVGADTRQAERALGGLQRNIGKLAIAAAVTGISVAVNKSLRSIDELAKRARAFNTTAASLRALENSASLAGISSDQLSTALVRVQRSVGEAFVNSSSAANKALEALGLSAKELSVLPVDQQIQRITNQLKEVRNPAERARLSLELLGRNGPLMLELGENVEFFKKRAEELGIALTQVDTQNIERANDAMARVGFIIDESIQKAVAALAPLIESVAEKLESAVGIMVRALRVVGEQSERILSILGSLAVFLAGKLLISAGLAAGAFLALARAKIAAAIAAGVLRTALIRTGIGILIVAVGELTFRFIQLSRTMGSVGAVFNLLGDVAREVLGVMAARLGILLEQFKIVGRVIERSFIDAFVVVVEKFVAMTQTLADGFNRLFARFGITIEAAGSTLSENLKQLSRDSDQAIDASIQQIGLLRDKLEEPRLAWQKLTEAVKESLAVNNEYNAVTQDVIDNTEELTEANNRLSASSGTTAAQVMSDLQDQILAASKQTRQEQELTNQLLQIRNTIGAAAFAQNREQITNLVQQRNELQEINVIANNLTDQYEEQQNSFAKQFRTLKLLRETNRDNRAILEQQFQLYNRINQVTLFQYDLEQAALNDSADLLREIDGLRQAILETQDEAINKEVLLAQVEQQRINLLEQAQINMHDARMRMESEFATRLQKTFEMQFKAAGFSNDRVMQMAKDRASFEMKTDAERTQFGIQQAGQLFDALGQNNRQAFEAAKALNIANAIMNTYAGATQALATYPPPFSFIAASAVVAMGLAQVATIRSQQYSGRALGGPVMAGQSYIVGERGPEVFTPSTSGGITPNNQMGGDVVNINFNIQANDPRGFDQLLAERRPMIINMIKTAVNDRGNKSNL